MRPSIIPVTSLLASLLMVGAGSSDISPYQLNKASKQVRVGDRALRSGNFDSAEAAYRRALKMIDAFPEASIGLGHVAMQRSRFEEALTYYRQAEGNYERLHDELIAFRSERFANSQSMIQEIRDKILMLQSPATSRGDARYQISKLELEIARLEGLEPPAHTTTVGPPGEIYFYIGNALFRLELLDDALAAWESCIEKSPEFALAYNNLALAYWESGRLSEARDALARAEELGFRPDPRFKSDLERVGQ